MFLYACLILLPAAALAVCHDNSFWVFFKLVDADNSSGIDRPEAYTVFDALDLNGNRLISLQEARQEGPRLEPELEGYIDGIFNLLDANKDGIVSYCDVETDFATIDKNNDGIKSKDEYKKVLEQLCGGFLQNLIDKL